MAPPDEPGGDGDRLKRALDTHSMNAVRFLILAKEELGDDAYNKLIKTVQEIVKQSANPDGGITIGKCQEILSEVFDGRIHLLKSFHHFLEARDPFHDDMLPPEDPVVFLTKVKASPYICDEDYNDLLTTLFKFSKVRTMTVDDVYEKAKKIICRCPEFIETFKTYLPPRLRVPVPNEHYCGSPMDKAVLSFTPDANHSLDGIRMKETNINNNVSQMEYPLYQNHEGTEYSFRKKHTQRILGSFQMPTREGNEESLHAEEYEGDKIDPLPDWSPSRENELPPKVDLNICTSCTPSYFQLPENCSTIESSYQTDLGRSIFNNTLVSATSGSEDCFKFRTKNQYEETIFKCEDDMFESDMLLQRFRATADFVGNLQDHVDSVTKIQEHLTPLHRRCIEQLYDDNGLDMLDALSEPKDTSTALAVLHSRLNQKIEHLSEARLSLHKMCSNIIASNYHRSLDHRSSSFKQLDKRRMSPKSLLAEAKEINLTRLNDVDKHLPSACNNQSRSVSDNATDLRIHEDIDSMLICYASSRSFSSEHKLMTIWTKLVQPFVSSNRQLPEFNVIIAPKEACDHCGLAKSFFSSIPDALLDNNVTFSSKRGECRGNTSKKSTSIHDGRNAEIEEGEIIPDIESIQSEAMLGPVNGAASYDAAASSGDGVCDCGNKYAVKHESRKDTNVEMDNLAYSKRKAELCDAKAGIPCCSLVVLCRLHEILYERLLVAKVLSREASAKALSRGSRTCDLYAEFQEILFKLLVGSTDNSNFEEYCLNFLGPRSYVLFTLDKLVIRVFKQLCKICPADEDNLPVQLGEKDSPGSLKQNQEEGEKGSKPLDDVVKLTQHHFQRRKKHKLENDAAS